MDNEIMESLLTEILEEQKLTARSTQELATRIKTLVDTVDSYQKKLAQLKVTVSPADTKVIQELVADGILKIQQTVAGQSKSVTRNFRLLLFPEIYSKEYYRIVFGRLLGWMMLFLLATYCFILAKQGIDGWQHVKEKEVESNHALKTWRYLYQHEKKFRNGMDSAWLKCNRTF